MLRTRSYLRAGILEILRRGRCRRVIRIIFNNFLPIGRFSRTRGGR